MTRINLPDRLVVMSNHQAYTDWMWLWIIAAYAGHSKGIIILLKASLKRVPVAGWGMVSSDDLNTLINLNSNSSISSFSNDHGRQTEQISLLL